MKAEGRRQKFHRPSRLWRALLLTSAFCLLPSFTATFRPAAPTVGDPIAIDFPAPVVLDKSPDYEIVSQQGAHVVVRTFEPKPFVLSGRMGDVAFTNLIVPVRSVLKEKDPMTPAPLVAPRKEPFPRSVLIAIAAIVLLAVIAIALLTRKKPSVPSVPLVPPAELFRQAVLALQATTPNRYALLANALRDYLAATRAVGRELTTAEVLAQLDDDTIAQILRHGDQEKFSPWGTHGDFETLAEDALRLAA